MSEIIGVSVLEFSNEGLPLPVSAILSPILENSGTEMKKFILILFPWVGFPSLFLMWFFSGGLLIAHADNYVGSLTGDLAYSTAQAPYELAVGASPAGTYSITCPYFIHNSNGGIVLSMASNPPVEHDYYLTYVSGNNFTFTATTSFQWLGSWNTQWQSCITSNDYYSYPQTMVVTSLTPPISVSFVIPTNNTTTQDFANWNLAVQGATTTDEYALAVLYQEAGQIGSFFDTTSFTGSLASTSIPFAKIQLLAQYETTSTWYASAYLVDQSMANTDTLFDINGTIVASSSAISFFVSPATSANSSNTYPLYQYPSATIPFSPNTISTSTCNGWTDFGCEIGNVVANALNEIFGINDNVVQNIAGFQLANTQPWSFVPEIENDFTAAGTTGAETFATSSISFDLGKGSKTVPFFSAQSVHMFIPDTLASFIRNLIYLALILGLCFVVYIEIKALFTSPKT